MRAHPVKVVATQLLPPIARQDMAESHKVPTMNCRITLALFTNVSNAAQLRGEALPGKVKAVLLDPTLVSAHPY